MSTYELRTDSNWWNGPAILQPPLEKDCRTDVVIIGGGLTGLFTALHLRKSGIEVTVLERSFAGSGASGRNSGYVDGLIGKDLPSLLKLNKIERARELCGFAQHAVRELEDFIQTHQIDCDYVAKGNIMASVHPKQDKRLQKLQQVGKSLGMSFNYLDRDALDEKGIPKSFTAGILDPVGGIIQPGKLVSRVREIALEAGVKLYENTPVTKVHNTAPVQVETATGTVTADQVVLATNAFTASLGWKKRFLAPIWAGMFESAPLSTDQLDRLGWHEKQGIYTAHEKLESYRRTERNTLLAGGKYVKIPFGFKLKDITQPKMAIAIEKVFRQRFPEMADLKLKQFWGGWIGIPLDFMPGIGVTGKYKNIHYGIGYAGHGVPQTLLVGQILADNIQGIQHPMGSVLNRKTIPIPPEPFKWLVSNMVDKALGALDKRLDRKVSRL